MPQSFDSPQDGAAVAEVLTGEMIKTCTQCGHVGLGSPISSRASFHRYGKKRTGYRPECRWCCRERLAAWREADPARARAKNRKAYQRQQARMIADSAYAERKRRQWRENQERRKQRDPEEYHRTRIESERRYRERHRERLAEERRIDRCLKREQEGKKLPDVRVDKTGLSGIRWPNVPYVAWLNELLEKERFRLAFEGAVDPNRGARQAVADALELSPRRLYDHLRVEKIDMRCVERSCARFGRHPGDLYPHAYGRGPTIWGSGTPEDPWHVLPEGWTP